MSTLSERIDLRELPQDDWASILADHHADGLTGHLGIELLQIEPGRAEGRLELRDELMLVGGGHLHGTVRGRTGDPLPDARVSLVDSWGRVVRVTASGPNGQYRFEELPEGEYTLVATMYPPVASGVQVTAGHKHQHDVELAFPEA